MVKLLLGWKKSQMNNIQKVNMPHFQIKLVEGKTEEQKQQLAQEVVKAAQKVIGYGEESYSVTIEDFSRDAWQHEIYPKDIMERKDILYKEPGYKM